MPGPLFYDPKSPNEQPVPLPSAPLVTLGPYSVLQPPLSRRGTGPGLVVFLPEPSSITGRVSTDPKPLDPEPIQKWAEEGFAVVGITLTQDVIHDNSIEQSLKQGLDALQALETVDIKDKFGVIAYSPEIILAIFEAASKDSRIAAFIGYGGLLSTTVRGIPTLNHITGSRKVDEVQTPNAVEHYYQASSDLFVLPQGISYDPGNAALAHSRTLVFLRKWLGGPIFDIEAIWDEHTYYEFEVRSVAKTMATMVAQPYVNDIPTMTGGIGQENLAAFYRDHFIFSNPPDARLQVVSRTVGPDRVVDEFVYHFTHDRVVSWFLPGIPPTGKKLSIPVIAVVNVRGDRLYNEHIWWDQAMVLRQLGILPTHVQYTDANGVTSTIRLPVVGIEGAEKLIDETKGESNVMLKPEWATGA